MGTMSDDVRVEYQRVLTAATIRHGVFVDLGDTRYGWRDYTATQHINACGVKSHGEVREDAWYEFVSTFADDTYVQGVSLHDVSCRCGRLVGRTIRWDAPVSEAVKAVLHEAYIMWGKDRK